MKRPDFLQLALVGISSGILVTSQLSAATTKSSSKASSKTSIADADKKAPVKKAEDDDKDSDPNDGNMNYHVMSEDELLLQLSPEGVAMYKGLDSKGKQLALLVASSMCDHTNECAGLNACQTDDNACAGKGKCKGQGKCAFSDKNLAVKLVRDKMANKRANVSSPAKSNDNVRNPQK